ncbi:MAG: hypothetical protein PVG89_14605 [Gammaproteobacteria bacterium]|jgi:hypothetical protein
MTISKNDNYQTGAAARNSLIVLVAVGVFIVVAIMLLPKGFSSDLSVIGKGTPVVVLAHNKDSVQSLKLMDMLNKVRHEYDDRMMFRVVDINTPEGRAFIDRQQVQLGTLLLFAPDGARRQVIGGIRQEAELRATLNNAFTQS